MYSSALDLKLNSELVLIFASTANLMCYKYIAEIVLNQLYLKC